ncbi:MAG: GUN4 N-terminal ARM-like repeat domain-containing protein [Prochloraceae cyanobacterium]|nr:GUN4 N-terminal ARM-like repeat domain-containing protein [Prochloraceae cyanobacterium]
MDNISQLASQFQSSSEKNQLQLISKLVSSGDRGLEVLMEFLRERQSEPANLVVGKAYQVLYLADSSKTQEFLQTYFNGGIIPLKSEQNIDYEPLQQLLLRQDFQNADTLTREKLCELAGVAAKERKWLYFTEVDNFPATDLNTINRLWALYSEGKFGFSVQRQIWLSLGKDFSKLWPTIGWKSGNNWTRYPDQFTWDLSAPKGHLPLLNQLRGVQVIKSLLSHPVWSQNS